MYWHVATFVAACLLLLATWLFYLCFLAPRLTPLRHLPGPPVKGLFGNHLAALLDPARSPKTHDHIIKTYGRTVRVRGVGPWDDRLLTLDPVSLSHVLKASHIYEKPWQSRRLITNLIGCGMLAAEGAVHKRQRRVATPAFGVQNLRAMVPIAFAKGGELAERWAHLVEEAEKAWDGAAEGERGAEEGVVLDIAMWISRATFDVIGLAGFGYHFNAIENESDELFTAYKEMFETAISQSQGPRAILSIYIPVIDKLFPDRAAKIVQKSQATIQRVAGRLIQEKKRKQVDSEKSGSSLEDRDLLSLLLKSNAAADLSPSQRISDDDILHNINTFMFAGSDTTSLALTWTLFLLSQPRNVPHQTRLRNELMSLPPPPKDASADELQSLHETLSALPFLDNVCKEGLRLIPPVHSSLRVATRDDVVPTSEPVWVQAEDGSGKWVEGKERHVRVPKGAFVHVPVEAFNLDQEVWGADAWEFNPDRWDHLPEAVSEQPGLYANTLTFSAGPRSCIGMRFSLIEMKVFFYILLRTFVFSESGEKIVKANVVLTRPYVPRRFKEGSMCPLRVSVYRPTSDPP